MPDECIDDPSIVHGDPLNRRIMPVEIYYDTNEQRWRPMSSAFEDNQDGSWMSVHLQSRFDELGIPAITLLDGHAGFGIVALTAKHMRDEEQRICRCHSDDEPAHAEVAEKRPRGARSGGRRTVSGS
ncbi:MAG: hypothetical protein WDO24_05815 [Pseudomonadota bacterium]